MTKITAKMISTVEPLAMFSTIFDEFALHLNKGNMKVDTTYRMTVLVKQMRGKLLTYKELIR